MPTAGVELLGLTVIASLVLPNWVLLVLFIPPLMLLSFLDLIPSVLTLGTADLRLFDIILLIVATKTMLSVLLRRGTIPVYPVQLSAVGLLLVFLGSTLVAHYKFGGDLFLEELVPLLRFAAQMSVVVLLALCFDKARQLRSAVTMFDFLGYVIAISVYGAAASFFVFRIQVGEVHASGQFLRSFGLLGDQVGFVLLFFIIRQWLLGHTFRSLFLAGALLSTGTRGAILALAAALLVAWWFQGTERQRTPSSVSRSLVFIIICVGLISVDIGGGRSRPLLEESAGLNTFLQRLQTGGVAVDVIADNVVFGVGYSGFRLVAKDYGGDTAFSRFWSPVFVATTGNQYLQVLTDGGIIALIAFIILIAIALGTFKESMLLSPDESIKPFMAAGYVWLLALALGNQSAPWMLPGSLISYLLWLLLAMAVAVRWMAPQAAILRQPVLCVRSSLAPPENAAPA